MGDEAKACDLNELTAEDLCSTEESSVLTDIEEIPPELSNAIHRYNPTFG